MKPIDPMAVVLDWLDAYRAASIDEVVGMYSADAVIECACDGRKIIHGQPALQAYWRHRISNEPALDLIDLGMSGASVVVSYTTCGGVVQALLDKGEDGLISRTRCGPI